MTYTFFHQLTLNLRTIFHSWKHFLTDIKFTFPAIFDTDESAILRAKFHLLARVSTLFFHRAGRELSPSSLRYIIMNSRALPPVILVSSFELDAGFPISLIPPLSPSFVSEIAHVCVRLFAPLFFGTRGERDRRSPTTDAEYRRGRYIGRTTSLWSNDRPYRRSIFPSRQQPRFSFDSAVEIDAIHLHRRVNRALYPREEIEMWNG